LFTGTFYMKISKTVIIYIVLSVTVIAPVWGSYFFALLVLDGLYKTLIPLTLSLIILIVSTRLFLKCKIGFYGFLIKNRLLIVKTLKLEAVHA